MLSVKGIIDKVASRKLAVAAAAAAGAAAGYGARVEITSPEAIWPTAFVAAAYILGQAIVDTWGE